MRRNDQKPGASGRATADRLKEQAERNKIDADVPGLAATYTLLRHQYYSCVATLHNTDNTATKAKLRKEYLGFNQVLERLLIQVAVLQKRAQLIDYFNNELFLLSLKLSIFTTQYYPSIGEQEKAKQFGVVSCHNYLANFAKFSYQGDLVFQHEMYYSLVSKIELIISTQTKPDELQEFFPAIPLMFAEKCQKGFFRLAGLYCRLVNSDEKYGLKLANPAMQTYRQDFWSTYRATMTDFEYQLKQGSTDPVLAQQYATANVMASWYETLFYLTTVLGMRVDEPVIYAEEIIEKLMGLPKAKLQRFSNLAIATYLPRLDTAYTVFAKADHSRAYKDASLYQATQSLTTLISEANLFYMSFFSLWTNVLKKSSSPDYKLLLKIQEASITRFQALRLFNNIAGNKPYILQLTFPISEQQVNIVMAGATALLTELKQRLSTSDKAAIDSFTEFSQWEEEHYKQSPLPSVKQPPSSDKEVKETKPKAAAKPVEDEETEVSESPTPPQKNNTHLTAAQELMRYSRFEEKLQAALQEFMLAQQEGEQQKDIALQMKAIDGQLFLLCKLTNKRLTECQATLGVRLDSFKLISQVQQEKFKRLLLDAASNLNRIKKLHRLYIDLSNNPSLKVSDEEQIGIALTIKRITSAIVAIMISIQECHDAYAQFMERSDASKQKHIQDIGGKDAFKKEGANNRKKGLGPLSPIAQERQFFASLEGVFTELLGTPVVAQSQLSVALPDDLREIFVELKKKNPAASNNGIFYLRGSRATQCALSGGKTIINANTDYDFITDKCNEQALILAGFNNSGYKTDLYIKRIGQKKVECTLVDMSDPNWQSKLAQTCDFTICGLLIDDTGRIIQLLDSSLRDVRSLTLRLQENCKFEDDPVRVLRFARYLATGFKPHNTTKKAALAFALTSDIHNGHLKAKIREHLRSLDALQYIKILLQYHLLEKLFSLPAGLKPAKALSELEKLIGPFAAKAIKPVPGAFFTRSRDDSTLTATRVSKSAMLAQ